MLFEASRVLRVSASADTAWTLLRDVPRLSGCIPGVSQLEARGPAGHFGAVVADRLGPFRLELPVEITVRPVEEGRRITAEVAGSDRRGQARVRGTLEGLLEPSEGGTSLALTMKIEVLGRLAALGAVPMRRRADEIFDEFARRVGAELHSDPTSD